MPKSSHAKKEAARKKTAGTKGITGKYVYDPKLGKVVKVSDDIPKVASAGKKDFPCGAEYSGGDLPCGQGECGGGSCGMGGFDD
ncbi:MAG: hypothetical protein HZB91_03610 [Elusimicrobia bacterium]|nr:hypothetical protein [Elusimicrobiota bacterium]